VRNIKSFSGNPALSMPAGQEITEDELVLNNMPRFRANSPLAPQSVIPADEPQDNGMLAEELFVRMLRLERKRTERSHRRFVLMILESGELMKAGNRNETLDRFCVRCRRRRVTRI
jgi:hypothetical protein